MWLVNTYTLQLKEFISAETAPPYAILSHTWTQGELTFQDVTSPEYVKAKDEIAKIIRDLVIDTHGAITYNVSGTNLTAKDIGLLPAVCRKRGFSKLVGTCRQAVKDDLGFAWIDTCCIDKRSSAELSEAINSMFGWYRASKVCYVYLSNLGRSIGPMRDGRNGLLESKAPGIRIFGSMITKIFGYSRWFRRGWTLQELLAPGDVQFFDAAWVRFAYLHDVVNTVSRTTGIPVDILLHIKPLQSSCVAQRMSWAATRSTTRVEDRAYSLLGIFNISMPLLYGEGTASFSRLQEEIARRSADQSLFAWQIRDGSSRTNARLFAPSVADFIACGDIHQSHDAVSQDYFTVTNLGLRISLPILPQLDSRGEQSNQKYLGLLACHDGTSSEQLALRLTVVERGNMDDTHEKRLHLRIDPDNQGNRLVRAASVDDIVSDTRKALLITEDPEVALRLYSGPQGTKKTFIKIMLNKSLKTDAVVPDSCWNRLSDTLIVETRADFACVLFVSAVTTEQEHLVLMVVIRQSRDFASEVIPLSSYDHGILRVTKAAEEKTLGLDTFYWRFRESSTDPEAIEMLKQVKKSAMQETISYQNWSFTTKLQRLPRGSCALIIAMVDETKSEVVASANRND